MMISSALDGWLNILKPPGMTSHDVVAWIRCLMRPMRPKIGHIGTLDPPAAGVLPLCIGKASRLSRFCEAHDKTYVFEITFGVETDTLDYAGTAISFRHMSITASDVERVIPRFIGTIEQTPPQFSAIKINGIRAYDHARRGEQVNIPARQVHIYSLRLLHYQLEPKPTALLEMTCSKGTYVRALCADICSALDTVGHISFLDRTSVGPFTSEKALILEDVTSESIKRILLRLDIPLTHLPALSLTETHARSFCVGANIEYSSALREGAEESQQEYNRKSRLFSRVYAQNDSFLGVGELSDNILKPEVVLGDRNSFPDAASHARDGVEAKRE